MTAEQKPARTYPSEDALRAEAVRIACHACDGGKGRVFGEPVFDAVTEGRQKWKGYAACGDLPHYVLRELGFRDEHILNREDDGQRKYILAELAYYFDDVLLPRIKKVIFSDQWKDGKDQGGQGVSHFVKYYQLEQYEDTLRKAKYEDSDLFEDPYRDPYNQYVFMRDLKMLEALEVDLEQDEVKVDLSKLYDNIDIAETLSNLRGKWIKKITPDFVEFEDGEKADLKNLDYRLIKPLIWW